MSTSRHEDQDYVHERERGWNRRKPLSRPHTPELRQGSHEISSSNESPTVTAKRALSRRGSSASSSSFDSEPSKRTSVALPVESETSNSSDVHRLTSCHDSQGPLKGGGE